MCKAHSKVTHIKQQKYFHHLKGRGYNENSVLYPGRFRWWKYFCCFICVTFLWALHIKTIIDNTTQWVYARIGCAQLLPCLKPKSLVLKKSPYLCNIQCSNTLDMAGLIDMPGKSSTVTRPIFNKNSKQKFIRQTD